MNVRYLSFAAALIVAVALQSAPARAVEMYDLDTSHMSIVFSCSHMNMSYTYGIFRQAQGRSKA